MRGLDIFAGLEIRRSQQLQPVGVIRIDLQRPMHECLKGLDLAHEQGSGGCLQLGVDILGLQVGVAPKILQCLLELSLVKVEVAQCGEQCHLIRVLRQYIF